MRDGPRIAGFPVSVALTTLVGVLGLAGCAIDGPASGKFSASQEGALTVATSDVPEAGFWTGTAEHPTGGYEYELARRLADRFGLERVEIRVVPFERIARGDLDGADLALSLITPTDPREARLDFAEPYLAGPPALLVRRGAEIADLKTAREKTIAVEDSTTLEQQLRDHIDPKRVILKPNPFRVFLALRSGTADAAMFDLPAAIAIANVTAGRFEVAAKLDSDETIAPALPEGSENAEAVSSAIRKFESDGTLEDLARRWLGSDPYGADVPLLRTSR